MNNKPDLLVVTPTRDRPEAFRLAVRWMKGQRFELPEPASFSWVVVDDGDKPLDLNAVGIAQHAPAPADPGAHHVYPNRILEEKNLNVHWTRRAPSAVPCTLHDNLDHFIEMLARHWPDFDGWIAIWEDDEYYAPHYLKIMLEAAEKQGPGLVGIADAHYWNVQTRKWHHGASHVHSSLCRTFIHRRAVPHLVTAIAKSRAEGSVFIDMKLWESAKKAYPCTLLENAWRLSIGIKGMPGRGGLGRGHKLDAYRNDDPDGKLLREWIGPDAEVYLAMSPKPAPPAPAKKRGHRR